jgi:hypothetical protein
MRSSQEFEGFRKIEGMTSVSTKRASVVIRRQPVQGLVSQTGSQRRHQSSLSAIVLANFGLAE